MLRKIAEDGARSLNLKGVIRILTETVTALQLIIFPEFLKQRKKSRNAMSYCFGSPVVLEGFHTIHLRSDERANHTHDPFHL